MPQSGYLAHNLNWKALGVIGIGMVPLLFSNRIQQLSEQRRLELSRIYGKIAANSVGVKERLNSYVSDLKEIQQYLSNDLTPKGIKAIEPLAREVAAKGSGLKYGLKDLQAAVNKANAAMAQ